MHEDYWRVQYEGLQDICLECGCFGHRSATCPARNADHREAVGGLNHAARGGQEAEVTKAWEENSKSGYDELMMVQKVHRR